MNNSQIHEGQPMPTVAEFLEARIAEDEHDALPFRSELGDTKQWRCDEIGGAVRYVGPRPFGLPDMLAKFDIHAEGAHVARWDPARVLAECAAKRAIIEWWTNGVIGYVEVDGELTNPLLPLASVYKNHPDYQQEWARG